MPKEPVETVDKNQNSTAGNNPAKPTKKRKAPARRPRRYIKSERGSDWYEKAEGRIAITPARPSTDDDD